MRFSPHTLHVICPAVWASVVGFAMVAMTAHVAESAELDPADVPVDAKWILHIDQESLSKIEVIEQLCELYPQLTSEIREWFKKRYGINLQEDLRSLTMFSRDYRLHTGTVLLETKYDEEKIQRALHEYDSLKKTKWKGHTLYTITLAKHHDSHRDATHKRLNQDTGSHGDDGHGATTDGHDKSGGKQMTVYMGDELIVLASSVPNAKSVLRLLEGDAPSLERTGSPLIAQAPADAVIYGAAIELGRLKQYDLLLPLLQQQEQCFYAFGERRGKLFETLKLTAQSEELAEKTTEVLEGLIAYEQLWAAGSEPLVELMDNVQISRDGVESTVSWEGDSELVVKSFDDLKARMDQWMTLFANPLPESLERKPSREKVDVTAQRNGAEQPHDVELEGRERFRERRLGRRGWLGAMIRIAGDAGVEIARVYLNSPADKAGLKPGDRIRQIDGEDASSPQTIAERISRLEPGAKINVVVDRDGEEQTVEVEVGNLEDFHERLFGKQFRQQFDDFPELFAPDFDGVSERVFSFRIPSGEDDESTLRELLRGMREELRKFRQEFQESNGSDRESANEADTEARQ